MTDRKFSTDVPVFPIVGYETAAVYQSAGILSVRYVRSEEELETGSDTMIRFALSPKIAREMAASLSALADRLSQSPPPSEPVQ